ncbi:tesB-like acyl-CoA thioesterase, partial [Idiomarina xiamenensis]
MTKLAPSLEQVLHQLTAAEDEQQLQLPSGWGQGRALFGGLTVAVVIEHLRRAVAAQQALRSLSVSFVAPAV